VADLNEIQSSGSTKIVGSDATGTEQTPVSSTALGELKSADVLNSGTGTQAALSVGTTAIEVKVNASPLSNRKVVTLYNNSNVTIYWGFTNGVTVSTGTPIFKNQNIVWTVGPSQKVFVIAGSAGNDTRITEA
jgi:hypothetical protein